MCARFTLRRRLNLIIQELSDLLPRHPGLFDWDLTRAYNICPTQKVAPVRPTADAGGRELVALKWHYRPLNNLVQWPVALHPSVHRPIAGTGRTRTLRPQLAIGGLGLSTADLPR
jgi:hypothetical protein